MRLVILDRDGVVASPAWDLSHPETEWRPIPGSLEAVARLNHAGIRVVLASNEGSGRRSAREMRSLNEMHRRLHQLLARVGGHTDGVFFCAHAAEQKCSCRLPELGLYREICQRFAAKTDDILVIAGAWASATAALRLGARLILLQSASTQPLGVEYNVFATFANLAEAVAALFAEGHA